jgi:hypothetical protein
VGADCKCQASANHGLQTLRGLRDAANAVAPICLHFTVHTYVEDRGMLRVRDTAKFVARCDARVKSRGSVKLHVDRQSSAPADEADGIAF